MLNYQQYRCLIHIFEFQFLKVGFWKVRVIAEGQMEELMFKVEKHYLPKYELVVSMPMFILVTEISSYHLILILE